jgi:GTPase
MTNNSVPRGKEKLAIIVQVLHPNILEYNKDEIQGLVKTARYTICTFLVQSLKKKNSRYLLGKGKVEAIHHALAEHFHKTKHIYKDRKGHLISDSPEEKEEQDSIFAYPPDDPDNPDDEFNEDEKVDLELPRNLKYRENLTIIFNNRLATSQISNLSEVWGVKTIDRDEIVLEIFEQNARTSESKLQIELARLALQTNIIKKELGKHLSEKQGRDFKGKGMAGWAPMMKHARSRQKKISDQLDQIKQGRVLRRKTREKFFNVGIIGYTNAGKTTLLNSLAKEKLETANQEFTTVSTTSRKVIYPRYAEDGTFLRDELIFSDSVGFVYDISPALVKAFLSTLEELQFSNLLALVIDISEESYNAILNKIDTTMDVISQIGASDLKKIFIFNKKDKIKSEDLNLRIKKLLNQYPHIPHIAISALKKTDLNQMLEMMIKIRNENGINYRISPRKKKKKN